MRRRIIQNQMSLPQVVITIDGKTVKARQGESVAAALLCSNETVFRYSPTNRSPRGPFCFMGACQECLIRIDGEAKLACQTQVAEGQSIVTGNGHG